MNLEISTLPCLIERGRGRVNSIFGRISHPFYLIGPPASAGRVLWNRVCPSVLPSVRTFSRNWLISFFLKLSMVLGAHIYVWQSRIFWRNPHLAKMTKNGQKWPKNIGLFKKITSLVLSGICVKWKFLWFINILRKLHAWEKSGSQVIAKNGSRPMRFQYSLIVNISLID